MFANPYRITRLTPRFLLLCLKKSPVLVGGNNKKRGVRGVRGKDVSKPHVDNSYRTSAVASERRRPAENLDLRGRRQYAARKRRGVYMGTRNWRQNTVFNAVSREDFHCVPVNVPATLQFLSLWN
jgi:hypothetical protein